MLLSKKELSLLKKKLEVNIEASDKNKNKSKALLKLVLNNYEITQVELEKGLYGSSNKIAFNKLIDRAIEKIDEVLLNFSTDVTSIYSERNYYYFYLKRKLLVIQMRLLRGIEFNFDLQLEKIISLAEKFEHYDVMIEALHARQRHVILRDKKAIGKIQKMIARSEEIRNKILRAKDIWIKLAVQISSNTLSNYYSKELAEWCKILKEDFEQTDSKTIAFYYYYLVIESHQIAENYREADVYLRKLLSLLKNNQSLYTTARYGDALINLANNEILLRDYSSAIVNAIIAKGCFENNSVNYHVASEIEFLARYYNGEIAEGLIEEIYYFCKSNGGPFLYSKYAYLYACIKTIRGEFEKSNELLTEVKKTEEDKGRWNLGKRTLSIINGIEIGDYESVELKVLNLEKFLKRISKTHEVRKRDKIIQRILLKLINENFDFNKVYKQRKKYFDLLESDDPEYCWKIKSPELIIFQDWFKGKMKEQDKKQIPI